MTDTAPLPVPPDATPADIERIDHTRQRRDLLYGRSRPHVRDRIKANIGEVREAAWGEPDLTAAPFLNLCTEASHLYDVEPEVRAPEASEPLAEAVADTGYWPLMQRVMRDTFGLREMLIRVDVEGDADGPSEAPFAFRPVFPDMVDVTCHPRRPSIPVRVREYRPHPELGWVRHDLDIRDPADPHYRVWADGDRLDVTRDVLGGTYSGRDYNYRAENGAPILPYGMYHAAETGCTFDPFTFREIVEGSLNVCVLLTYYGHLIRNAAWAQRYAVNLEPVGMDLIDPRSGVVVRREVVTDPSSLLCLRYIDGAGQAQIGQWVSPADPEATLRSIGMYERRMILGAGLAPPDVTRQEADIRSGYSLAVDREAARERQRIYAPQFRRGDQNILRIAACLSNRFRGTAYTEIATDYRPVYTSLPKSPAERRVQIDELGAKRAAGLIGPVSALRELRPELTDDEAVAELAKVATETALVERATAAALDGMGITKAPPVVDLEVGKVALIPLIVEKAVARLIPVEAAREALVTMGVSVERADAIMASVKPTVPKEGP